MSVGFLSWALPLSPLPSPPRLSVPPESLPASLPALQHFPENDALQLDHFKIEEGVLRGAESER